MKSLSIVTAFCGLMLFSACNNGGEKAASTESKDTTKVAPVAEVTAPPAFKPFDMLEISHVVKDYAKWKPAFDTDSTARKANGLEFLVIGKSEKNPNSLMVVLQASDVQKAKEFAADPRLKDVMQKNGVISKPTLGYFHVTRFNPDSKEKQWVVITHKVKDYDTWLKTYDAEGTTTRASFGLVDVVLAQSIDDPKLVQIVFDIKDMAKAKARISDPALKKLMMDAGVEGPPTIEFYTSAE
jgi:hypothetical protein